MQLQESRQRVFLLYGPPVAGLSAAVREYTTMPELTSEDVVRNTPRYLRLLESKLPFAIDVSQMSFVPIFHLVQGLRTDGIQPVAYIYETEKIPGIVLSEHQVRRMTTVGLIRRTLKESAVGIPTRRQMIRHMTSVMEAQQEQGAQSGPKVPSEVDRMKATQKQQEIMLKQRQSSELLGAKQRELAKKTRDDMNKIKTGENPVSVTR
jgi:hypothetical protein